MVEQLLRDPSLLLSLIGDVTVGETYFFRLRGHFAPLIAAARSALARAGARFSIWSAGCAAGEEPYSIALALRDALPISDLHRVTILGTDVDRSAIAAAEAAVYGSWSFRGVEAAQIDRGFRRLPDERYQLLPELRHLVTFRHYPLREHLSLLTSESLDAIFYRNVSVYLSDEANESMYQGFARVLRPGGLLFIAPTDIRPKVATLRAAKSPDCTIFERRASTSSSTEFHSVVPTAIDSSRGRPLGAGGNSPDSRRTIHQHADGGELPTKGGNSPDPWHRVDQLADAGDLAGALELLARQADAQRHSPAFHKRRGRLHLAH
ncbi:MAG: CheR family methyltransferase, partial [Myxococcales bacterium]